VSRGRRWSSRCSLALLALVALLARAGAETRAVDAGPRLALIIDDLGYDRASAEALAALPVPLTVAVLPHLAASAEVAESAWRRGCEVILHLPMQSASGRAREAIGLRRGMDAGAVDALLGKMLETVPHAVGVSNHQGSLATADPALMDGLMAALRARGLFFIDSRTTRATVAAVTAEHSGVRASSRNVFLDNVRTRRAILDSLRLAGLYAERNGSAIAIGHPHPVTVAALAEGVAELRAQGIRFVVASEVVR
jgi:hypothetical protein